MNTELFYTDNGHSDKAPLVLLHGNGGNSSSFFYVVDHFAKKRRVITVDTRGHGRSPKGEKPFTLSQFADDLKAFLDTMGIEKAVLVGYSDGGNIAMIFAEKYLPRVSGLVLNGANAFPKGLLPHVYNDMLRDYRNTKRKLRKSPSNQKLRNSLDLLTLMIKEPNITPAQLEKMNVPALVLVGSHDVISFEHTQMIANSLPNSSLKVVEGGHGIVKSNSADYIEALEEFFSKNDI